MEILSNPWVVGIGGGILSGLIVAIITRKIFSKRDNREYLQKVLGANREVLYAIRPGISEGLIPSKEVVDHLIKATARKYSVEPTSMLDISSIASELIKEVMDSSFISAQTKQDFCEKLSALKPEEKLPAVTKRIKDSEAYNKYRAQMVGMMAAMAGLTTSIAGFYIFSKSDSIQSSEQFFILVVPAVAAIFIAFLSVLMRELTKAKLKSFRIDVAGIKADFSPRTESDRDGT